MDTKACGLDDVFPPDSLWFVRMLGVICVVCKDILLIHSFNKLNLIFPYHSSVTSRCALSVTTSVPVKAVYTNFVYVVPVFILAFSDSSNRGYPTATITH